MKRYIWGYVWRKDGQLASLVEHQMLTRSDRFGIVLTTLRTLARRYPHGNGEFSGPPEPGCDPQLLWRKAA